MTADIIHTQTQIQTSLCNHYFALYSNIKKKKNNPFRLKTVKNAEDSLGKVATKSAQHIVEIMAPQFIGLFKLKAFTKNTL